MIDSAYFGGGCFWCLQPAMDALPGVKKTMVGFMGGKSEDASYEKVYEGSTDHVEIVAVEFNPEVTSYRDLLWIFWKNIQPTQENGQFGDVGRHYRSVVFAANDSQYKEAKESLESLVHSAVFSEPIVTSVEFAKEFYLASEKHQAYAQKNPEEYQKELEQSGRSSFLSCGGNLIRKEHLGW